MSKHGLEDTGRTGYFMSEESQFRLQKLRGHMLFLSQLAQPRTHDEDDGWGPEIGGDQLAVCLEVLADQAERVLDALSWPARRDAGHGGRALDDAPAEAASGEDEAGAQDGFSFGVTPDQIDALHRLAEMLSAHGDMASGSAEAAFTPHTVSRVGRAIHEGGEALREILRQVKTQRLGRRVGDVRGAYGSFPARRRVRRGQVRFPVLRRGRKGDGGN